MAQQLADRRDLDFVVWEQMNGEEFLTHPIYGEFNRKTCDMIITEARAFAINVMLPTLAEGDARAVRFENGNVKVPDCFHRAFRLMVEGEWNNLTVAPDMGGQGVPALVGAAATEFFMGANWALYVYAAMGNGAADLIQKYGTEEQKNTYIEKLVSAQWGGTMLLTESEAGSDVGALATSAVKNPDGTYAITGNKIFITNGEHDLMENIIHPVLARIEGDPPGTRGISLFLVPKFLVNKNGSPGERNDIVCTGVEEKHGIHGSATCSMTLGGKGKCTGYLLGEAQQGMRIMFNMINGARMGVGLQALSYASSAYLLALNYARERIQGRELEHFRDASAPSVPIIKHPDVRRMLLFMKSYVDGMRSFFYYLASCGNRSLIAETEEERVKNGDIFDLLTPVLKDYLANRGHEVCVQAIQAFGGAGYSSDYPVEQYARDCKITSIYEGTSGIQAMDLLARKIGMKKGAVFMDFLGEIHKTVAKAKGLKELDALAGSVEKAATRLGEVAFNLGTKAMSPEFKTAFANSHPFLDVMGDTIMAWMLLWRASVAVDRPEGETKKKDVAFYEGQIATARFYIETLLPATMGKMNAIDNACPAAIEISDDGFGGL